ncbi:MAG: AmmeMemoRadiSam system protein B [Candidatus Aenigmatarchaeota archaeon]
MLFVRPPAAAGRFYDLEKDKLKKQLDAAFRRAGEGAKQKRRIVPKKIRGAVVPHAGYEYSGHVAARFYSLLDDKSPRNYVILGPNHYTFGQKFATMKNFLWKTPLGGVAVNEAMVESIMRRCELLQIDVIPHQNEHSIEVQLPFLQSRLGDGFKFVPIAMASDPGDPDALRGFRELGEGIADAIRASEDEWAVIASSDFSHYVPQDVAEETDGALIKAIVKMDEGLFFNRVSQTNATVCGPGPIISAIVAAKKLGASKAELLKYATSGDVTNDYGSVVGYASIVF